MKQLQADWKQHLTSREVSTLIPCVELRRTHNLATITLTSENVCSTFSFVEIAIEIYGHTLLLYCTIEIFVLLEMSIIHCYLYVM